MVYVLRENGRPFRLSPGSEQEERGSFNMAALKSWTALSDSCHPVTTLMASLGEHVVACAMGWIPRGGVQFSARHAAFGTRQT